MLPDFKLPIEDLNNANFWLEEWWNRYEATSDDGFKESAQAMERYIELHFPEEEDGWGYG